MELLRLSLRKNTYTPFYEHYKTWYNLKNKKLLKINK